MLDFFADFGEFVVDSITTLKSFFEGLLNLFTSIVNILPYPLNLIIIPYLAIILILIILKVVRG